MNTATPTILIVDDMPTNIQVLRNVLKESYHLLFATHGEKALELARTQHPDLILLDVMMPDMDGYQVCGRLQGEPETRDIPIIFVTARGEEEDETRGLGMGAIDYLTKPISPPIVLSRVRNHLLLKQARDALAQRNQALEEAARLREEVEHITRHDMKSPLASIIGFSELLLEEQEEDPATRQRYLTTINAAAYRLLNMVNNSLHLYRLETGGYQLQAEPVDLLRIIRRVWEEHERLWEEKSLQLALRVAGRQPEAATVFTIQGEELLLHTLVGNLLGNALEAAPAGSAITVALNRNGDHGEMVIHNAGAVPEAIRERFFSKFVTAGKHKGTGLGTYSARLIARIHGGDITMASSDEAGTRISVTLPLPPA